MASCVDYSYVCSRWQSCNPYTMAPRAPAPPSKSQCLQTQVTTVRYGAVDTRLLLLLAVSKQKTHCRSGFTSQHRSGWAHRRKRPSKTGSSEINDVSVGAAYFLSSSQKGKKLKMSGAFIKRVECDVIAPPLLCPGTPILPFLPDVLN